MEELELRKIHDDLMYELRSVTIAEDVSAIYVLLGRLFQVDDLLKSIKEKGDNPYA